MVKKFKIIYIYSIIFCYITLILILLLILSNMHLYTIFYTCKNEKLKIKACITSNFALFFYHNYYFRDFN